MKRILFLVAITITFLDASAQCTTQVTHTSGTTTIGCTDVTVTQSGMVDVNSVYCASTFPYFIGYNYGTQSGTGSYTFTFSPPINSATLNVSGLSESGLIYEEVHLYVNGAHYAIPSAGTSNGCDAMAVLTANGDIGACSQCGVSGWNGTNITGPISTLTVMDTVFYDQPNGGIFSLFICGAGTVTPINLGNDTTYCGNFNQTLSTGDASTVWSTGATASQIVATNPGTYWATISNGCGTSSDTIVIGQSSGGTINLGNDTSVCAPNTVVLDATISGAVYQWQDNSTSSTFTVTQSGIYMVTVSVSGCISADTINVNTNGLPAVNIQASQSIFCASDSAQICSPSGFVSYLWNTGETTDCIYATHAGNYYVTVSDANNCTATSNHLPIFVYPLPPVSVSVNGDTLRAFNAVSYQWYFNNNIIGGATDSVYITTQSGNYTVEITDTNGCHVSSNAVTVTVSGLKEIGEEQFSVYPNPNTEGVWQLQVDESWLNSKVEIFDAEGKLVFNSKIRIRHSELSLDVSRGVYLLRFFNNEKTVSMKMVKF